MKNKKSILFISANDFKEKSIQVIRKTPEAYVKAGWDVTYIVSRDNSQTGNYFYEDEINPKGVDVQRIYKPFTNLQDKLSNHTLKTILSKISGFITIFIFTIKALKVLKTKQIDVIYGYEVHGVLAVNVLRIFQKVINEKVISRFQGVFYINPILKNKRYLKMIFNFDHIIALKLSSDLSIMTNDGTQGDRVFKILKSKNLNNYRFWSNGVDNQRINANDIDLLKNKFNIDSQLVFITVSRLVKIKRIDRSIKVMSILKKKYNFNAFKYLIIGDGNDIKYLKNIVYQNGLEDNIIFVGAISNDEVKNYLSLSNIFFSTFNSSNVGNPLLEAIRANKIIFTLNNGDTSRWIQHKKNGFIYDINDDLYESMAKDINEIINNKELEENIFKNIKITEKEKLWTWNERMNAEVKEVEKLLMEKRP